MARTSPLRSVLQRLRQLPSALLPLWQRAARTQRRTQSSSAKVSEALQGKNILVLSAKEENYKAIAASAGLAYGQKVGAESAVDINLAKQLNVLITQMGVAGAQRGMNVGSATAGYGFEYVVSTLDRVKGAALGQNDHTLQMPIVTPVGMETWGVKEAIASESRHPRVGLPGGARASIWRLDRRRLPGIWLQRRHPAAPRPVTTVAQLIAALM